MKFKVNTFPQHFTDENGAVLGMSKMAVSRSGIWMAAVVKNVLMRIHIPTKTMQTVAKGN